ncbi:MAG: hypothetical protein AB1589_11075 [Cyanobacteriota bacterium]
MKLKTFVTIVTLTAFSILLTQSSIAYACEEENSTPAQSLKTIRDDQSGLVFEVASNYRAVPKSQTEGGVWKEIYIMEPTAYCYLQIPNSVESSEALMGANYVLIQLFSGSREDVTAFLDRFELNPRYYQEVSINGSKALVGNDVVAINHPNGQYWAIIHDTTSDNLSWASDFTQFSRNNQVLLNQIYQSIRWKNP